MQIKYFVVIFISVICCNDIALSVAPAQSTSILKNPTTYALYPIIMAVLRILSEVFLRIAKKTEAKWDNKVAKYFSWVIYWVGKATALFGFGKPKMIK